MIILIGLILIAVHLGLGGLLFLFLDGRPRTEKFFDHVSPWMQLPMLVLWPVSLPWLLVRHARHR